ncbi:unnamed protein product [Tetraodon nigroviridis]|uniref:(spotted green pufferfish) hypothetical protein n=1 Tax=Tetraodon nigroviridis TaxID=99883 RepID=Q4SK61_TETNG|nr:unnamed protein product [Tetraodon nigroviridis]
MRPSVCSVFALCLLVYVDGRFGPAGQPVHVNDGNFSHRDLMKPEPSPHRAPLHPSGLSAFSLKVWVTDALSRWRISHAGVDVYINCTRMYTVVTGDDGGVLINITYQKVAPVTVVVSKDGYLPSVFPYKARRLPNSSSWPVVQFPKSLLNLTDSNRIAEVKAYLTVPQLVEDSLKDTPGIVDSSSGYMSVDLHPVAAVGVRLFLGDAELHVCGPVQISLSVPGSPGLQPSTVLPAWFFNQTTGGWMRKGLGTVKTIEGKLLWTFSAPHLGYWMAAPASSTTG